MRHHSSPGFSLIELIVGIGIGSLLIIALTIFVARSFTVSRVQFEQVRITEDARLELERISDALRNARYVDRNNNGVTSDAQESWLLGGNRFDVVVYTNIDADPDAELVRYFTEASSPRELRRSVTQLEGTTVTGQSATTTLSKNMRNFELNQPLFAYYAQTGGALSAPISTENLPTVARIGVTLIVDVSDNQKPDPTVITTDVTPRTTSCVAGNCQPTTSKCVPTPGTPLGPYPYSSDSFVEDAAQGCKTHCSPADASSSTAPGSEEATCPWQTTYSWDGVNSVTSYCSCGEAVFPSPLPDTVPYGQYTDYYKDNWEACSAVGQTGQVACNPGYELDPGSVGSCTSACEPSPAPGAGASPTPSGGETGGPPPPVIIEFRVSGSSDEHVHAPKTKCPDHGHFVTWRVDNATSCTAAGAWSGLKEPIGDESVVTSGDGDFTATCHGPGGQATVTIPMRSDVNYIGCN